MKNVSLLLGLSLLILVSCNQETEKTSNAIPYPLEEWKGVQGKTLAESKPDFIGQKKAKEGSPNVIIIMLDDAGYSSPTSFGGVMKTPTFDRSGGMFTYSRLIAYRV